MLQSNPRRGVDIRNPARVGVSARAEFGNQLIQYLGIGDTDASAYVDDPVGWIETALREHPWSIQKTILESVRTNRRTAVKSCHDTGKSWIAARAAAWWIASHPPGEAFVVTTAPSFSQVRAVLWREIGRAHAKGKLPGRVNQTEWFLPTPDGNEEIVAFGRKPADWDPAAFQGIHSRYVLFILDEACGIPVALWDAGDSLIANEDSRVLAIGNPDDPTSEFFEVCKPGSGWNVIQISAFDTPNFTGEPVAEVVRHSLISPLWVEERKMKWGAENPVYISKVLGEFPDTTVDGLIPLRWIRAAQSRELEPTLPIELGVDVGGGANKNVIACRRGGVVRIIHRDQNPDTMKTLGNTMGALAETGASRAKIDAIGIGHGAADRAKEIAADKRESEATRKRAGSIEAVNVGDAARDTEAYLNLRAEGYWGLRERFELGEIDIDPEDDDLAAQLAALTYERTSSGKIVIESKKNMKKEGRESPDEADAVMLAFLPAEVKKKYKATW